VRAVALFLVLIAARQTFAQAAAGTISGSVIDARTAAPLAHATATLTSADGNALLLDARGASFTLARTVTTSAEGTYRFTDLPIGAYHLRIQRLGYEPATIDVRLGDTGTSPVSIGLIVLPVRLRAVEVRAHDSTAIAGDQRGAVAEDPRLAAVHARQQAFLSTDARELTPADVAESATIGGSDVLRSLQRLPGVTPFDDWSAKLWVRGNRWDHNRVYYDNLPLFDPLGVLGRVSGVNADAIGGAFLHPGVRPVSLGGDGATRIDLRTRPASGAGAWRGSAELTQFGASGAIERATADTSAGFLMTAHHSLGQWLPTDDALAGRSYRDEEATARGDLDLDGGKRLETSGLLTRDARIFPNEPDGNDINQEWRNAVGRVTFSAPFGPVVTSHHIGISHFSSSSDRYFSADSAPEPIDVLQPHSIKSRPVSSSVDYVTVGGQLAPRSPSPDLTTLGYDVILLHTKLEGTQENVVLGDTAVALARRATELTYGSVWVNRRTELGNGVTLENGGRLDIGGGHRLDAVRPSGSTQAAFALSPSVRVSVGASRVYQYIQGLELPIIGQGQTQPSSYLASGDDVPLMTVDNAMAGVERWVRPDVLVAGNVYVRRTTGAITDDPTPGSLSRRPLFVDATESASGIELSARKLMGRATGLVSYSFGSATMHSQGLSFPAPASRTHALDAALSLHVGSFNVGGAYTFTSGAPYTRSVTGAAAAQPGVPNNPQTVIREAPNAQRLPNYSSLDASVDYTRVIGAVTIVGFAGAQNLLGRKNATWYEISGYCENGQTQLVASPQCANNDVLSAPVKFAPTVGLRLVVR